MGYDPSDYFDFREYDQHNTIPPVLEHAKTWNLIVKSHDLGLEVIADIFLNHNSVRGKEYNPFREKYTYTNFDEKMPQGCSIFNRSYGHFHLTM